MRAPTRFIPSGPVVLPNQAGINNSGLCALRTSGVVLSLMLSLMLSLGACSKPGPSEAELMASAQALLDKKDRKGAIIQLKNVLQVNAESATARLMLGKTLLESGDPASAVLELQKAQELQTPEDTVVPELARALLASGEVNRVLSQFNQTKLGTPEANADLKTVLAMAHATRKNVGAAHQAADEALLIKPGYAPALIVQARLTASEGKFDEALKLLEEVLAGDANHDRAGLLKGDILWRGKGQPDAALAAFKTVATAHPESVTALASAASIHLQRKDLVRAKAQFEVLKKNAPEHPETLFLEAQLAMGDNNFKAAREIAERLLKALPDNMRALELAGAAEFRMQNYVQAEALLTRAMKAAPREAMARQLLAQTHLRTGHPEKALEVLQPLLEGSGADGTSWALAGEAHLQGGDNKRSEEAFARALKASPADARVRTAAALARLAGDSAGANNPANTGASSTRATPQALAELEAIASGDTGSRADLALISARLGQGDLAGALTAVDALEKKMPNQALPANLRGRVLMMKRDLPGATKAFEAALAKEPAYFPAVASLATLDLASNKPELARKRFEEHLKANPTSFQSKVALAELDARGGAPLPQVVATLKEAVRMAPTEPGPQVTLVNRLLSGGEAKAAMAAAQDASAALPGNVEVQDALGRAQIAAGDGQRAVSTFKKLASMQSRNPLHEVHLADAYMQLNDRENAGAALRRATELQPQLVAAQRGLALLALANNKPQEGLVIAKKLQQVSPKDAAGFSLEGDVEAGRKNWDAAAAAYRVALPLGRSGDTVARLHSALTSGGRHSDADRVAADWQKDNPKDGVFLYYLGDTALSQNKLDLAETRYRAVLEVQPNNALALNNVAWLLVKQGKPGALPLAERAVALLADRPALLDTLGLALEADKQLPKAIEVQKRAIALAPNESSLVLRLAQLYIKQGDKSRARAELESLEKLGDRFTGQPEVAKLLKGL
jgi:cellulose synthase operon protein C